ncbi:MAG: hypothetical protein CMF52_08520 [Legionellales bacterium]|nr:hypothetical protein [Legionellales bacterium]|tara:strand:- start:336 stop:1178 length:843 start_codon:yes stop_codon:yes gene_type:complete
MTLKWSKDARFSREEKVSGELAEFIPFKSSDNKAAPFKKVARDRQSEINEAPNTTNGIYTEEQIEQIKVDIERQTEERLRGEWEQEQKMIYSELKRDLSEFTEIMTRNLMEKEPLYQAVRELSLAFGEEIALHALSAEGFDYERHIEKSLEGFDLSFEENLEFSVSKRWAEKIASSNLQGILSEKVINIDEKLSDGDVLIRIDETLLSSFVSDRVAHLKAQLKELNYNVIDDGDRTLERPFLENDADLHQTDSSPGVPEVNSEGLSPDSSQSQDLTKDED